LAKRLSLPKLSLLLNVTVGNANTVNTSVDKLYQKGTVKHITSL